MVRGLQLDQDLRIFPDNGHPMHCRRGLKPRLQGCCVSSIDNKRSQFVKWKRRGTGTSPYGLFKISLLNEDK